MLSLPVTVEWFPPAVRRLLGSDVPRRLARTKPDEKPPVKLEAFEQDAVRRLYGERSTRVSCAAPAETAGADSLRIAVLAPPWIPIPPPGYGGIEAVLDLLCAALHRRGHDVTLFAAPGSRSPATVVSPLQAPHPEEIERALYEVDHVARAFELIEAGIPGERPYDVIHDHCGFTTVAMADRVDLPVVHTLHGPIDEDGVHDFYRHHGRKISAVAISRAQASAAPDTLRIEAVIPNPIDIEAWPLADEKDDYLLWIGRMTPGKGPHRAIEVARRAGSDLVLAGPVQPGQEAFFRDGVEPRLGSPGISYVGEVGGRRKRELFARARALLMPIRWPEPFGMVMIEAMAAGTPVIAFAEGSAPEIVQDGENGFLVADEEEMAAAIVRLGEIDPQRCRESARRFGADEIAAGYERVYRRVTASSEPNGLHRGLPHPEPVRERAGVAG